MQPRAENDRTAANPGDIIMRKAWDRSPVVDPWAFDPTQPPETAVPLPPQNLTRPVIVTFDDGRSRRNLRLQSWSVEWLAELFANVDA
jgi:hypothetical protein